MLRMFGGVIAGLMLLGACDEVPMQVGRLATQQEGAGFAAYDPPAGCMRRPPEAYAMGSAVKTVTSCALDTATGVIGVQVSEITTPWDSAFDPAPSEPMLEAATAMPRAVLMDFYLLPAERAAQSEPGPGFTYANRRIAERPGSGGVPGAEACLEFSFDATAQSRVAMRVSGLRCAKLDPEGRVIREVVLEVLGIRPAGAPVPARYDAVLEQVGKSLRYTD